VYTPAMADLSFFSRNVKDTSRFGVPLTLLFASLYLFIHAHITSPLTQDEVEYLHSAWLMNTGLRPFTDFFQHHSPFFFWLIALFVKPGTDLSWIINLRMLTALNFSLATLLVLILGRYFSQQSSNRAPRPIRADLVLWVLLVCTVCVMPLASFEVRAEQYALVCWLSTWVLFCNYPVNRLATLGETIALALLTVAVLFSPRTLPAALAILPFSTRAQPLSAWMSIALRRFAILALFLGIVLWATDTTNNFFTWVIGFSHASGPSVSITDSVPGYLIIGILLALLAVLLDLLTSRGRQNLFTTPTVHWVVLATLIGFLLEPRQFSQSLTFLVFALLIWGASALLRRSAPASTVKSSYRPRTLLKATSLVTTLTTAIFAVAAFTEHASKEFPAPGYPLSEIAAPDDLWQSVRVRETLCERYKGETVLVEPTTLHPICLHDASYFWRGSEYLLDGTLERAGIHHPQFSVWQDISHNRPGLLALNAPLRTVFDSHQAWLSKNYQRVGAYWVRREHIDKTSYRN
jgi:hypothetical protein